MRNVCFPSLRPRRDTIGLALGFVGILCCVPVLGAEESEPSLATRARGPVALRFSPDGTWLFAANSRSGTLSVIDPVSQRVVAELEVGRGLADLGSLPDGRLLAVDREADSLLLLDRQGPEARVVAKCQVAADPVQVLAAPDGAACVVASTASRRLSFVDIGGPQTSQAASLAVSRTVDLPFSPRHLVVVPPSSKLVVADAYGGKLAVVDVKRGKVEHTHTLPAHNIRGLTLSPDGRTLVVAHLALRKQMQTDFEGVHWGRLLGSHLQSLRLDAVLAPGSTDDLMRDGCRIDMGFATQGAGDPSSLGSAPNGSVAIALGGVDEVALCRSPSAFVHRVGVGRGPSAVAVSADGKTVFVAGKLDDSISVVEAETYRRLKVIALGPRPESTLVERGESLFHDATLSHDGWMSCQSCHTDGHTSGLLVDTLGDDSYGAPKKVPSLLGVGRTGPWAWNGSIDRLEHQVRKSITITMQGRIPTTDQVEALTAYLESLAPPRAVSPSNQHQAEGRGQAVFATRKCGQCHGGPEFTTSKLYDVGLVDEVGNHRFNPPSLRGVSQRDGFFHDGRAGTLEAVFLKHGHPRESEWTETEVADLVAFLKSL